MSRVDNAIRLFGILFFVASTLHYPIAFFIVPNVYIIMFCLAFPHLLLSFILTQRWKNSSYIYPGMYFSLVIIASILSLTMLSPLNVIKAMLSYVFFQIFFLLYIDKYGRDSVILIAKINTGIALLSGALGVYQVLYDPVLFGMYAGTKYDNSESWSVLRASSLFYSTQVYASYMAASIVFYDLFLNKRKFSDYVVMLVIIIGGVFSGSVGFFACIITYIVLRFIFSSVNIFVPVIVLLCVVLMLPKLVDLNNYIDEKSPVKRALQVFDTANLLNNKSNIDRLDIWATAIDSNKSIIFGHGVGSSSNISGESEFTKTESYILSLYYEGGILLFGGFLLLIVNLVFVHNHSLLKYQIPFAVFFIFYASIVHVYYAVNLPVFWVLLFSFLCAKDKFIFR